VSLPKAPRFSMILLGLMTGLAVTLSHAAELRPNSADFAAAAAMLAEAGQDLVRNASVEPHWIGDSGRFWYRRAGKEGPEFVVVTANGKKSPAFDHARLSRALGVVLGKEAADHGLPASLGNATLSSDLARLTVQIAGKAVDCNLTEMKCQELPLRARQLAPSGLLSSDGQRIAFTRDDNLFVREVRTGDERPLTTDGGPLYSWAKWPDSFNMIARQKIGQKMPLFQTYWSPDGHYIVAPRIDERNVAIDRYMEWVPTDGSLRPVVHEKRLQFVGDREEVKAEYFVFDLTSGERKPIRLPEGYERGQFDGLVVGWSRKHRQAFLMARTIGSKSVAVFRLDLASGGIQRVIQESSETRVEVNTLESNEPNIRVLGDGTELLWYSDRTGWGHLYLYDAQTGRLKNAVTSGEWLVRDIIAVDETRREIYFTASGREIGQDPYYRHLYRAALDGHGSVKLLARPDADHEFAGNYSPVMAQLSGLPAHQPQIGPRSNVFVDTWSTVDQPPVTVLRSTRDGHSITELEQADAARLFSTGWKPPQREHVIAADGKTEIYADYFAPYDGATGSQHPVIDGAYGGPQLAVAPVTFLDGYRSNFPPGRSSLARLGFAVVTVDGRGTPDRSRAFRDAGFPNFTQVGIDDHIAAIKELARRHSELDVSRVGIYGWSWGGTFTAQAILSRPQFYKVAVAGAGVYDYAAMYPGIDNAIGVPVYADGSRYHSKADESPVNWSQFEVTRLAGQLTGHLMIVYGDLDENVPAYQAMRLVDALTRANKIYDLVYLPNRTHGDYANPYVIKRTWDYFVEHLDRAPPDQDFQGEHSPRATR